MARRGRKPKMQAPDGSAEIMAASAAAFAPIDLSWLETAEREEIGEPLSDEPEQDVEPDKEPEPDPTPDQATLTARPVTDADVDRLWDWVRQDEDRGLAFLG